MSNFENLIIDDLVNGEVAPGPETSLELSSPKSKGTSKLESSRFEEIEFDVEIERPKLGKRAKVKKTKGPTDEELSNLLPNISIAKYNEPEPVDGSVDDLFRKEETEPKEHFEARMILTNKIMNTNLGLNPVACETAARMIMKKVRLGIRYTKSLEDALELITLRLE